jgi:large subunit ribosomal protein L25
MKRSSPLEDGRAVFWAAPTGMDHSKMPYEFKASARSGVGKGAARALRREGLIPAVIYGDKQSPLPIAISTNEARKRIFAGGFLSHIITVDVGGEKHKVIPRDYQLDPVKDFPLHVDFLRIGANSRITVEVHVAFINDEESPGLKRGGTLNIVRHTVELSCPADSIPEQIEVDLTGSDIGDSFHISAVKLPSGIEPVIKDRDFTIATLVAPSSLKSEEAAGGGGSTETDAE